MSHRKQVAKSGKLIKQYSQLELYFTVFLPKKCNRQVADKHTHKHITKKKKRDRKKIKGAGILGAKRNAHRTKENNLKAVFLNNNNNKKTLYKQK